MSISWRSGLQTRWAHRPEARVPPKHKTSSLCPNATAAAAGRDYAWSVPKLEFGNRKGKSKKSRSPGDERAPELQNGGLLLADHGRAEEAQHLIDWICDRISAAAGEKQSDRTRIGCYVFNH